MIVSCCHAASGGLLSFVASVRCPCVFTELDIFNSLRLCWMISLELNFLFGFGNGGFIVLAFGWMNRQIFAWLDTDLTMSGEDVNGIVGTLRVI